MAYKFQRGEAILSGALLQEGNIEIEEGFSFSMHEETIVDTSRNLTVVGISGSANLQAGGTMTVAGASDLNGALDVAGASSLAAAGVLTDIRGTLSVDEAAVFDSTIQLAGALDANSTSDFAGAMNLQAGITVAGASDLNGALDVAGLASLDGGIDVNGTMTVSTAGAIAGGTSYSGSAAVTAASFAADGAAVLGGSVTAGTSFIIGSADLNEADMEKLDGITNGTAAASKAVVLDGSKDISGLNDVSAATYVASAAITAGTSFIIGSADLNEADMEKLDGITNGTAAADKAVVLDASKDISGLNDVSAAGLTLSDLQAGRVLLAGTSGILEDSENLVWEDVRADNDGYLGLIVSSSASGSFFMGDGALILADSSDDDLFTVGADGISLPVAGDETAVLSADSFYFYDATDSMLKRESMVDYAAAIAAGANEGLASTAGRLKLDLDDLVGGDFTHGFWYNDTFAFVDVNDSSITKKESLADLMTKVAGDGITATNGVLAVGVHGNGGIEIASDSLQLNIDGMTALGGASIAQADELAFSDDGTVKKVTFSNFEDSIFANVSGQAALAAGGALSLDVSAITAQTEMTGDVADADELIISDGGVLKRLDFSVLRDAVFADVSGDAAVAAGGALTIAADAVEDSMVNDNVATGLAGVGLAASSGVMSLDLSELSDVAIASGDKLAMLDATDSSTKLESIDDIATLFAGNGLSAASAVLALDLNELTGETLDVAADSFAFIDATDNSTKKESIADLVSAMAGAGLTAASGVLKVTGNDVHLKADGDTLQEGYNYFADISADAGVTLPASPTVGDVVHIKAGNITGDDVEITVTKAGSQTIDGDAAIYLESPFAAVSLVYVASDAWRIV